MNSIYLIDFEDSFTFNIANEIWNFFKIEVNVVNYREIAKISLQENDQIILGPGPGHPDEYSSIFTTVKTWLENPKIKVIGICLGHQIIWTILGAKVIHSTQPVHGKAVELTLDQYWKEKFKLENDTINVQRYNSLVVDLSSLPPGKIIEQHCLFLGKELMASQGKNFASLQFHPESIGTEYRQNILGCLLG